jgi:hypothetical protein
MTEVKAQIKNQFLIILYPCKSKTKSNEEYIIKQLTKLRNKNNNRIKGTILEKVNSSIDSSQKETKGAFV